jgi:hypothetical protein
LAAQTVQSTTFGNSTATGSTTYTGYTTHGSNKLRIYSVATGYDSSYWLSTLQNANKCGFNIEYIDADVGHPETIVTYADGSVSSFNITGELESGSITNITDAVEVDIGTTVTSIGIDAFSYCSALTSVTIPDSVTAIDSAAFGYCHNLNNIIIPSNCVLSPSTFKDCSSMSTITFENRTMA